MCAWRGPDLFEHLGHRPRSSCRTPFICRSSSTKSRGWLKNAPGSRNPAAADRYRSPAAPTAHRAPAPGLISARTSTGTLRHVSNSASSTGSGKRAPQFCFRFGTPPHVVGLGEHRGAAALGVRQAGEQQLLRLEHLRSRAAGVIASCVRERHVTFGSYARRGSTPRWKAHHRAQPRHVGHVEAEGQAATRVSGGSRRRFHRARPRTAAGRARRPHHCGSSRPQQARPRSSEKPSSFFGDGQQRVDLRRRLSAPPSASRNPG